MLVTITNVSSSKIYVSTAYASIAPSGTLTISRTAADVDRDDQLKQLVVDGLATLSYAKEATDLGTGWTTLSEYATLALPVANTVSEGAMVYDSDLDEIKVSVGGSWKHTAALT